MKGFEKERNKTPNPLWVRCRFYVLLMLSTAILITVLLTFSHGENTVEILLSACISLLNAVSAYLISKRNQGKRPYKEMIKNIKNWMIVRFIVMVLLLATAIVVKLVNPLPFIFTFIGFYILHQIIEITVMQKEIKQL